MGVEKPKPFKDVAVKKKSANVPLWAWVVSVVLVALGLIGIVRWGLGAAFVADYEHGTYREDIPETLHSFNFPQPEVGDYDMGLIRYRQGDYVGAEGFFTSAALQDLPEGRDCDTRVNLALSICNQMDLEAARAGDESAKAFAIERLHTARDILVENGCAADDGSHHDEDAEQLKEDIDKLLEELEDNKQDNQDNQQQDQNQQQQQSQGADDPLKEKLKDQEKENSQKMKSLQDVQDAYNNAVQGDGRGGSGKPW